MKPGDIAREIVYPLSSFATLVPMLVSWLLFLTASFFGLFGLLLFVATVVPFFGYLMSLLDARANRKKAPAFDVELMSFVGNGWALFPLVLVALFWWLHYFVEQRVSSGAATHRYCGGSRAPSALQRLHRLA